MGAGHRANVAHKLVAVAADKFAPHLGENRSATPQECLAELGSVIGSPLVDTGCSVRFGHHSDNCPAGVLEWFKKLGIGDTSAFPRHAGV